MSPANDLLLSQLTVRLRNSITFNVLGSGVMVPVKDKVYILTAAHCLYTDKDSFQQPLEKVIIDIYQPSTDNYVPFEKLIDHNLVWSDADTDVAVLLLDNSDVESITGELPFVSAITERQSATEFVVKGFPNATDGKELDLIRPVWKQEMTGAYKFQLQLNEDYSSWATAGFSGSGIFLHTHGKIYLYGIFTRFRKEELGKVIYAQYLETVNELLAVNWFPPIPIAFFGEHGLNHEFFDQHIVSAVKNLGPRFNEKLNLKLPISKLFNVIAKDERFKHHVLEIIDSYLLNKSYSSFDKNNEIIKAVETAFEDTCNQIREWMAKASWQPGIAMDFEQITNSVEKFDTLVTEKYDELYELQREKQKTEVRKERDYSYRPPYENELYHLHKIRVANDELLNSFNSSNFELADAPFLLIKGDAGCGKSHMLGDIATARAARSRPSLLLLGQLFKREHLVWKNILEQLQLNCTKDELLITLNAIGRQIGSRVLIFIDALNEGDGKIIWPNELPGFISEVGKYPYIGVVMTIRSTYWDFIVSKPVQEDIQITKVTHQGFKGNEYEALKLFCTHYDLKQPNFPILAPEYANPLFLQLVCEGVKATPNRKFPQGFQGITRLFGFYLSAINQKLSAKREEYVLRTKLAEEAIMELARTCFANQSGSVTLEEAVALFDIRFPKHPHLLNDLIQENVFIKSLRQNYDTKTDEDIVYFSYERFGDFFIAQELLKGYSTADELIKAYQSDGPLGKLLLEQYYQNHGIIEAMAVILPERFQLEIIEVYDWAFAGKKKEHTYWIAHEWINSWLLNSLKWRTTTSVDEEKLSTWFNSENFRMDFHQFLNTMIELAPISGHPFNSDRFHRYLMKFSMAERDGFLQQFFYYYQSKDDNGNPYPIRRLIDWSWQPGISILIDEETARLTGQFLAWALSVTQRQLRDQVTKAMVNLLEEQPGALIQILKAFKEVDDPYIQERLYAVAYGCALRNSKIAGLQQIAQYVYDTVFSAGSPRAHILLRDYARNTIEYALYKQVPIQGDMEKIRPPYSSPMPESLPTEHDMAAYELDYEAADFKTRYGNQHNRIKFSVMEWDFGRYTIESAFRDFCPYSFKVEDEINRFLKSMQPQKRSLIKLYITIYESLETIKQKEENGQVFTHLFEGKPLREIYEERLVEIQAMMDRLLAENDLGFITTRLVPFLNDKMRSKDRWRYGFETLPYKRWIVRRAFELGYNSELHGEYDSQVEQYNSRSENKVERIGKKYQWIALHEILAYTTDNFKLRQRDSTNAKFAFYQGPWQMYLRDVDPAFVTRKASNDDEDKSHDELGIIEPITDWWSPEVYSSWNQPNADWILNTQDMPDPKQIILRRDEQGVEWLYINLNVNYNEPKPVGLDKYQRLKKDIWYYFQAYLIRKSTKSKIVGWLEKQNFYGRWMPESHSLSDVFNRESYWSPAYKYHSAEQKTWHQLEGSRNRVMLATAEAVGELSDDKSGAHFGYMMPCQLLFEGLSLQYALHDGDFKNAAGEVIVTNINPKGILIRKKELLNYLEQNELEIVWTLLGEKNLWSSQGKPQGINLKSISGVYTINSEQQLSGNFRILDR